MKIRISILHGCTGYQGHSLWKASLKFMRKSRVILIIPLLLTFCSFGCAVNNHGLVKATAYENDSAYLIHLEAWGVHLSTLSSDGGVSIGHILKTYVVQKNNTSAGGSSVVASLDYPISMAKLRRMSDIPSGEELGNMVAIIDGVKGIKVFGNSWRGFGLVVGAQTYAALRLLKNFNGILAINLDTKLESRNFIYIKEVKK